MYFLLLEFFLFTVSVFVLTLIVYALFYVRDLYYSTDNGDWGLDVNGHVIESNDSQPGTSHFVPEHNPNPQKNTRASVNRELMEEIRIR